MISGEIIHFIKYLDLQLHYYQTTLSITISFHFYLPIENESTCNLLALPSSIEKRSLESRCSLGRGAPGHFKPKDSWQDEFQ
jgi:hypothetical protein